MADTQTPAPTLGAADFLRAAAGPDRFPPARLEVPGLGAVFVRKMSAGAKDRYNRDLAAAGDDQRRATILGHALCDERGNRLYVEPEDVARLADVDGGVADAVIDAFGELNAPKKAG